MSKKGKQNKNKNHPQANPAREIEALRAAAAAHATESDLEALKSKPPVSPGTSLEDLIAKGHEALLLLEVQQKRSKKEEETAKTKQAKFEEAHNRLESKQETAQQQLAEARAEADKVEKAKWAIEVQEKDVLEREESLSKRELDADAGFMQRNRQALESLDKEAQALRDMVSSHRAQIAAEREAWEKELHAKRAALESERLEHVEQWKADVKEREETLADLEADSRAESARLRKEAQKIEIDRELVDEDRQALKEKAEKLAAKKLEAKDSEIKALRERLDAARRERDDLESRMRDREEADRRFGERTPEEVLDETRRLRQECEKLRKELGSRPTAEALQHLEALERQRETWETERPALLGERAELKQRLARMNIEVTELEALRAEKEALQACNELLTKTLEDKVGKVQELVNGPDVESPFPSCSQMDNDDDLQATGPTVGKIQSLQKFAEYVRHRMAHEKALFYSAADVRSFLGGLAMSKLHLLQGISGTGKTSLPLAFARAIGAGHALIEVQAGWRDRQDLIGHYNTFERRFYESAFLQALYKASCPLYAKTPFVVVLDEMNLSHPEQYFADLLSALEQEPEQQRLDLMTASVASAPEHTVDGGKELKIPPNVWFVGTANHDETTKDFADKTYDRAHVMELPRHRDAFQPKEMKAYAPISLDALQDAFDEAFDKNAEAAEKAYNFLEEDLGPMLGDKFGVGWGNRLESQMKHYVPVVIDCGGSLGEATDHVLATKLLRKIQNRYDNRPEAIKELRQAINAKWPSLDPADPAASPAKSLDILKKELKRLGHDEA